MSYQNLLRGALSDLSAPVDTLEALTENDFQTFEDWNRTFRDYPQLRVTDLFEQRAAETPDRIAVSFENKSLSYRELLLETNRLAARLQGLGVCRGHLVGICMDRSTEMLVALLAVFRVGAAYLPMDPAYPADRIAFMQEDAQPQAIITQSHLQAKFEFASERVLTLDHLSLTGHPDSATAPEPDLFDWNLDDQAYLLYTSGSTGKPKGVQITHRALTNLLTGVVCDLSLNSDDVFLATTTISFDISAFELFAPLITGSRLVIAPRTVALNGELLADAIAESEATVLQATPSGWRVLLESGWTGQPGLKMLTAGEPLDRTLAHRLLDRGIGLWNLYGPTEATIYATGKRITKDDRKITVGIPLANYTAYVLDQNRNRLPVGAVGELYLGGVGVASGYLNREQLTSEKFIPNTFAVESEDRLYRTGDLARFLPDSEIEVLGRVDNQVKLRGYRIELEEIEALFDRHPCVRKSVARVTSAGEGDERLVAYIISRDSGELDHGALRAYAMESLPVYMVPTQFIPVESFALSPSGKIDRKALPPVPETQQPVSEEPYESLETTVLNCWRSVLKVPDLDLDQDFFAIGGHSLLAARMFSELDAKLECKLPISMLLEAPTARGFAALIKKSEHSPVRCVVTMQPEGSLPPLYLVHHLLGDILVYRTVANSFAPQRPVSGIQPPADLVNRPRPYSLHDLAAEYVSEILERQNTGPFHLAGFSSGSVMAFEIACQLTQMGHEVGLLALIDGDLQGREPEMPKALKYSRVAIRKLAKIVFKMRDELSAGPRQFVSKRLNYVRLLMRLRDLENSTSIEDLTVEQALLLAERSYTPKPYPGSALLIRFHDEAWSYGPDPMMGWTELIEGGIQTLDFPGGHITGMSPVCAPQMAEVLRKEMEAVEAAGHRRIRSEKAYAAASSAQQALAI